MKPHKLPKATALATKKQLTELYNSERYQAHMKARDASNINWQSKELQNVESASERSADRSVNSQDLEHLENMLEAVD